MHELPSIDAQRDTEVEAISHILIGVFADDHRVWRHVDLTNRSVYFDRILDEDGFSTHERALLMAAASIWKGGGYPVELGVVAWGMDDRFLGALLNAFRSVRGRDLPGDREARISLRRP